MMQHPKGKLFAAVLMAALLGAGCQQGTDQEVTVEAPARLSVYVTHYPLSYFVERIGGDRVEVHFPAPVDVDPAEWRPDEEVIVRYQQADLILLNGAGYERWLQHVSLPRAATVDTARNIQDRLLEVPDAITHSHGHGGHIHSHAGTAFTTWLDPLLAIEQARVVKQALVERVPDGREEFEGRFRSLAEDLRALDRELEEIVGQSPDRLLLASHPVYHYLEARYDLKLRSLHFEPDEMPEPSGWENLDALLSEHPARWILWEDEPLPEIAARLRERGVESLVYNPTSQPPEEGDLLSAMRQNAANLRRAFAPAE